MSRSFVTTGRYVCSTFLHILNRNRLSKLTIALFSTHYLVYLSDPLGIGFVIKPVLALLETLLLPGAILLILLNKEDELGFAKYVVYSFGLSAVIVVVVVTLLNQIAPTIDVHRPLSFYPLFVTILSINVVLASLADTFRPSYGVSGSFPEFRPYDVKMIGLCTVFVFLSVIGAHLNTNHSNNIILVLVFSLVFLFPIVRLLIGERYDRYDILFVWTIALIVLFGNMLSYNLLNQGIEYKDVLPVFLNSTWLVDAHLPREFNLTLMILLPAVGKLSDTSLFWVFKYAYPMILSLTPVVFYLVFREQFTDRIALFASILFMYIHPFYVVLLANRRTGFALLFLALLMLVIISSSRPDTAEKFLVFPFSLGILFSHYGTSHLFLAIAATIVLFRYLLQLLPLFGSQFSTKGRVTVIYFVYYILIQISWDMFITPNRLRELVEKGSLLMISLINMEPLDSETDAAVAVTAERTLPITVIRYLYILAIGFISIGLLYCAWNVYRGEQKKIDVFAAGSGFFAILALSATSAFAQYDVRRIFTIGMVALAPFCVLGMRTIEDQLKRTFNTDIDIKFVTVAVLMCLFFLFSSGLFSAVATYERSPNPVLNKNTIIEKGNVEELDGLLHEDMMYSEYRSSTWISRYRTKQKSIFLTGRYLGQFSLHERLPTRGIGDPRRAEMSAGLRENYVHVGYFSTKTGNYVPAVHGEFSYLNNSYPRVSALNLETRNKIYTTNKSTIYL